MIVAVCLDPKNGMTFNDRRQSRDRVVVDNIIKTASDNRIRISEYSQTLFADKGAHYIINENPLEQASATDFCFIENIPIRKYADKIEKIIVYRWDKQYPQTQSFDIPLPSDTWALQSITEFPGHSHEIIKKEVYCRVVNG